MKKSILLASFLTTCLVLNAQSLKKTLTVKQEEVPVAVRQAFKNDFGNIPDNGFWTVDCLLQKEGSKTVSKPIVYTYTKKIKPERIEVRYTPDGKLESIKGIDKLTNTTAGDSTTSLKKSIYNQAPGLHKSEGV